MRQSRRSAWARRKTMASPRPKNLGPDHTPLKPDFCNKIGQQGTHSLQQNWEIRQENLPIGAMIPFPRSSSGHCIFIPPMDPPELPGASLAITRKSAVSPLTVTVT